MKFQSQCVVYPFLKWAFLLLCVIFSPFLGSRGSMMSLRTSWDYGPLAQSPSESKSCYSVRFNSKVSCIDKKLLFIPVRALLLSVYIISSFVTVNHPRIVTVILIPTAVRRFEGSSPGVHHWLSHKSSPVTIIITIYTRSFLQHVLHPINSQDQPITTFFPRTSSPSCLSYSLCNSFDKVIELVASTDLTSLPN